MNLRVTLKGLYEPYHRVTRTFHKSTILNASELFHLLSKEHLDALFPLGDGIRFDIINKDHIVISPENRMSALLDGEPMLVGEKYKLKLGEPRMLDITKARFELNVIQSDF
jgi:hypothetical protein